MECSCPDSACIFENLFPKSIILDRSPNDLDHASGPDPVVTATRVIHFADELRKNVNSENITVVMAYPRCTSRRADYNQDTVLLVFNSSLKIEAKKFLRINVCNVFLL